MPAADLLIYLSAQGKSHVSLKAVNVMNRGDSGVKQFKTPNSSTIFLLLLRQFPLFMHKDRGGCNADACQPKCQPYIGIIQQNSKQYHSTGYRGG